MTARDTMCALHLLCVCWCWLPIFISSVLSSNNFYGVFFFETKKPKQQKLCIENVHEKKTEIKRKEAEVTVLYGVFSRVRT